MGRSSVVSISLFFIFSKVDYDVWRTRRVRSTQPLIQLFANFSLQSYSTIIFPTLLIDHSPKKITLLVNAHKVVHTS